MLFVEIFNFYYQYVFNFDEFANEWYELPYFACGLYNNNGIYESQYFNLCDYLCLICSIITMVAILLFCVFIIKKIIAIIFRLFTGGSAF